MSKRPQKKKARASVSKDQSSPVISFKPPSLKGITKVKQQYESTLVSVSDLLLQARESKDERVVVEEQPDSVKGLPIISLDDCKEKYDGLSSLDVERVYTSKGCESDGQIKLSREYKELVRRENASLEADLPMLEVKAIEFGMWSTKLFQQNQFVVVTNPSSNGSSSVHDPRMGTIDRSVNCSLCKLDYQSCLGHPGYIVFKQPILHPQHINNILRVLTCVCNCCSKLLLTTESINLLRISRYKGEGRLIMMALESKDQCCSRSVSSTSNSSSDGAVKRCVKNPAFIPKKTTSTGRVTFQNGKEPSDIPTEEVLRIIHHISEEDAEMMGFRKGEHPENLIISSLYIPPPGMRPPVVGNINKPDYIDKIYNDIISLNNKINPRTDSAANLNESYTSMVGYVNSLFGSSGEDSRAFKPHGGLPDDYRDIKCRLHGKGDDKIIKGNLISKRARFTARLVVGPGPRLRFGRVGFPRALVHIFTPKETVSSYNIDHLTSLLRRGQVVKVNKKSGMSITIINAQGIRNAEKCKSVHLSIGDTILRCLEDGDAVIINRQPSIHKYSMLGHQVTLIDGMTIEIHPSVTSPLNADFDGDEIVIHLPQTYAARIEVLTVMNVISSVMSSEITCPMIGCVIDAVMAFYKATSSDLDLSRSEWDSCVESLMYCGPGSPSYSGANATTLNGLSNTAYDISKLEEDSLFARARKHGVRWYSSRMLFSCVFPSDFTYSKGDVKIVDGIILPSSGPLTSQHVSKSSNSVVHALWMSKGGSEKVRNFLTDAPWLADAYLRLHPISVGSADHFVPPESKSIIKEELARATLLVEQLNVNSMNANTHTRSLEALRRESEITAQLNRASDIGDVIIKQNLLDPSNNLGLGVRSGSKGTPADIGGMLFCCGTQFRRGKRMIPTKDSRLPMFPINSIDPRASGFVEGSYFGGLDPAEYIFCAAASREGLIDTSNTTSMCGFLDRKNRCWMLDITTAQDNSVRNGKGIVILPLFGFDGFKLEQCCQVSLLSTDSTQCDRGGISASSEASSMSQITFFCNPQTIAANLNAKHNYH